MQCWPVERERRIDHGLDVGGAGIAITVPCVLGQRACHLTPFASSNRVFKRLTAHPLFELIAVRWGTRKNIIRFFVYGVASSNYSVGDWVGGRVAPPALPPHRAS